jgi:hypothetical protein
LKKGKDKRRKDSIREKKERKKKEVGKEREIKKERKKERKFLFCVYYISHWDSHKFLPCRHGPQ